MKHPKRQHKNAVKNVAILRSPVLVTALVASMVTMVALGAGRPKLVVGIVVDGLRQETLDLLKDKLSADGFNRFLRDGVILENVDFGTNLDAVSSTAVLMTGASPAVNGISGELRYDPVARRLEPVFKDDATLGNYTSKNLSPAALRVSTLSDEARIDGAGATYVYSIAPNSAQALLMAGHAGNSAVWFNEETGDWASSTYFGDMPTPALAANRTASLKSRIDTMQWTPGREVLQAGILPNHLTQYPFRHTFTKGTEDRYVRFAATPFINREVTALAENYIRQLDLGKHDGTDVLNIGLTLQPYTWTKTPENRLEQLDSYFKLDKSLAGLFSTIDRTVGRDNAVIYIAATPPASQRRRDDEKWNIPTGEFSTRKAMSLLNLHLLSLHGEGQWTTAYHDGHFYLNEALVMKNGLNMADVRREAAEFLVRMSGIDQAYSIDDITSAKILTSDAEAVRDNTVLEHAGDVIIRLEPGWMLNDDYNNGLNVNTNDVRVLAPATAVFMVTAPGLISDRIDTPVSARAVAPTVGGMIHIRSPNGADKPRISLKQR
ncbi:MAG: alkaline phosphatase family protein [Muribaculaceae bacterium]|nr:alkaline phosphatase family protein [Muribaculaceae bacterium]